MDTIGHENILFALQELELWFLAGAWALFAIFVIWVSLRFIIPFCVRTMTDDSGESNLVFIAVMVVIAIALASLLHIWFPSPMLEVFILPM